MGYYSRAEKISMRLGRQLGELTPEQAELLENIKERWTNALKEIRSKGIKTKINVNSCCRSCTTDEDLGLKNEDQPNAWTFGGQGERVSFNKETGAPYYSQSGKLAHSVYFNWGGEKDGDELYAGRTVATAFKANGFAVNWDGTISNCVEVKFLEPAI